MYTEKGCKHGSIFNSGLLDHNSRIWLIYSSGSDQSSLSNDVLNFKRPLDELDQTGQMLPDKPFSQYKSPSNYGDFEIAQEHHARILELQICGWIG